MLPGRSHLGITRLSHGDLALPSGLEALSASCGSESGEAASAIIHCAASFSSDNLLERNIKSAENAVRAAAKANARLVLVSSMAAVRGPTQAPSGDLGYFTSEDWNESEATSTMGQTYQRSKADSERAAWRLAEELGVEMTSLCPSMIFGWVDDVHLLRDSFSVRRMTEWMDGEKAIERQTGSRRLRCRECGDCSNRE